MQKFLSLTKFNLSFFHLLTSFWCPLPNPGSQRASLVAQLVKNPPATQETWVHFLGWEDPLEKGKATHSSILAWRFHGLFSPWGHKESDVISDFHFTLGSLRFTPEPSSLKSFIVLALRFRDMIH